MTEPLGERGDGAGPGRRTPRAAGGAVFVVTALGCVHGLARPLDRQRGLPGARALLPPRLAGHAGLGDHRLQHRVRVAAGHRRPHGRPARAAAALLRRARRVQPRFGAVRRWRRRSSLLVAGRLIQGIGAAAMLPASLGLLLGAFPTERRSQVVALWGGVGALAVATGPRSAPSSSPVGWRWAFFVNLPGRRWWPGWSAGGCSTETPSRHHGPSPDYLGVPARQRALAALVLGHLRGTELGLVEPRRPRLLRRRRRSSAPLPPPVGPPSEPVLDLTLFRSRSFSVAKPPPCSTPWASSPCCSATSSSSPGCGTTRSCEPAWPSPRAARGGAGVGPGRQAGRPRSASGRCCWSGSPCFAGGLRLVRHPGRPPPAST